MTTFSPVKTVAELLGDLYDADYQEAFPEVQPPFGVPFGSLALLQLRTPRTKLGKGFLVAADETKDTERYRVQVGLVRGLGPMAFHDRKTLQPWPEGAWYAEGDFIRGPMYGGDRFDVKAPNGALVSFILIEPSDALAPITGDPLTVTTS
jgi:hypothetical protein